MAGRVQAPRAVVHAAESSESLLFATTSDELPPPAASWRRARLVKSTRSRPDIDDEDDEDGDDDTAASVDSSLCLVFSREVFDTVAAEMPVSGLASRRFCPQRAPPPPSFRRESSTLVSPLCDWFSLTFAVLFEILIRFQLPSFAFERERERLLTVEDDRLASWQQRYVLWFRIQGWFYLNEFCELSKLIVLRRLFRFFIIN